MATAKKTPAKKTAAKADDDLLSTKAKGKTKAAAPAADEGDDDLLSTKPKGKGKPAAKKAPAKKASAKSTVGTVDDVKAVLLKTKKLASYADIASANNFDVRMVRRTARALRDEGSVELQKEGTIVYVKKV